MSSTNPDSLTGRLQQGIQKIQDTDTRSTVSSIDKDYFPQMRKDCALRVQKAVEGLKTVYETLDTISEKWMNSSYENDPSTVPEQIHVAPGKPSEAAVRRTIQTAWDSSISEYSNAPDTFLDDRLDEASVDGLIPQLITKHQSQKNWGSGLELERSEGGDKGIETAAAAFKEAYQTATHPIYMGLSNEDQHRLTSKLSPVFNPDTYYERLEEGLHRKPSKQSETGLRSRTT